MDHVLTRAERDLLRNKLREAQRSSDWVTRDAAHELERKLLAPVSDSKASK